MDVVCTAGHVDHGKSALVRALTGMEPDRFVEERRRGLTIDIGFAWTTLAVAETPAHTVAFVDLPGHERFIANMLAGAGPVRAVLFVVAADEGWMPQSQEHLEILDLLGVTTGVVAVSRADLVDDAAVQAVITDVRQRLAGTGLARADILAVSAVTGSGLDPLRRALLAALASHPQPAASAAPRLWVDRSFVITGAGTVTTGTLTGGTLHVGDDVVVSPSGHAARVRGLQSLKQPVDQAHAGDRVAVNLSGVQRSAVTRGDVVTVAAAARATRRVDVAVRVLDGRRLTRRGAWHLHAGSGEWAVTVRPLGAAGVTATGYARIELQRPAPLLPGDRCVLREAGRRATVAGAVLLDTAPPAGRVAERVAALGRRAEALAAAGVPALVAAHVAERATDSVGRTAAVLGLDPGVAAQAAADAGLWRVGDHWVDPPAARGWADEVRRALSDHHRRHPLDRGAPADVALRAAQAAGCPAGISNDLLTTLADRGAIAVAGAAVRHPDHDVRLSGADQRARDALIAALEAQPFAPPPLQQAAERAGVSTPLLRELITADVLVRLAPDLAVTRRSLGLAGRALTQLYAAEGPFTASRAKQALGTTRKFAVPLLEALDRRGLTRREGDLRHISGATSGPQDR